MRAVTTIGALRAALRPLRAGRSVGLVPTMGSLHEGHLTLICAARRECDLAVVSSFVNPIQFGPDDDFGSYPRDARRDASIASDAGVDVLFAPTEAELYPEGYQTWVEVDELGRILEGAARPGHFRGVATVCLKLFNIVQPDRAYFGQKDAQQAAVVERMVSDLDLELAVRVLPTVRDADGLALSSRNAYLSPEERTQALALPRALRTGFEAHLVDRDPVTAARAILADAPGITTDYVEIAPFRGQRVLAAAVRVGRTRLIDNVVLDGDGSAGWGDGDAAAEPQKTSL